MKPLTLADFKKLTLSKKSWHLSMQFFAKCTNEQVFKSGRPSPQFFRVKKFFEKQSESELDVVFQYLNQIEKKLQSITEMFYNAQTYNQRVISSLNTSQIARKYQRKDVYQWLDE